MSYPKFLSLRKDPPVGEANRVNLPTLSAEDLADVPLIISGQGVFLFTTISASSDSCSYSIMNAAQTDGIIVEWMSDKVQVMRSTSLIPYVDPTNSKGLTDKKGAFYWFSIDAQNQRLYAGVGEARKETKVYEYTLSYATDDEREANKAFLESLTTIGSFKQVTPLKLLRDPITSILPHRVKHELSLDSLAKGLYMPKSHLSAVSQQMYECVQHCVLDTDDFPEFSQAIKQSIADGWCKERLLEKSGEFSKEGRPPGFGRPPGLDPNVDETYLRITLGENNGESPGIPYVLEIWPAGHYSPIHSHGGAEAIIKVLHGDIHVKLFPFLGGDSFLSADFTKDDLAWISPNLNQTHQLQNRSAEEPCMTIQCYMYSALEDSTHYDYFNYLDNTNTVQKYEPDSDMDFVAFKELMREEWYNRKPNTMFSCLRMFHM